MKARPELEALRARMRLRHVLGYSSLGDDERELLAGHYCRIIKRHPMASSPHWLPRVVRATWNVLRKGGGL